MTICADNSCVSRKVNADRAERRSPQPSLRLTARSSPYVSVPRSIGFVAGHLWRERICTFTVFSALPTAAFWFWFITDVLGHIPRRYSGVAFALPLSSLWITFGPILMQQGEFNLERLLCVFNSAGEKDGWSFSDIQSGIARAGRIYYWFTIPMGVGASLALALAFRPLTPIIALQTPLARLSGLLVLFAVGFVSASGILGVFMALSVVRGATKNANVIWLPFRSGVPDAITELYSFVWSVAVIFSAGSVYLPILLVIWPQLPTVAGAIVIIFMILLFAGGLLLFSVPQLMLYRLAQTQRDRALDKLAPLIEQSISQFESAGLAETEKSLGASYSLVAALRLRAAVADQSPAPVFNTLGRAAATLALPIFLTLIQVMAGLLKK